MDTDEVRFVEVPFSDMLDGLDDAQVDAIATVQPYMGAVEAAGHTSLGDPFLAVDSPAVAGMWIADREWAQKNPGTIASFIAALNSADRWASAHTDGARTFLSSALRYLARAAQTAPLPNWDTSISPASLEPWIQALAGPGQVVGDLPATDRSSPRRSLRLPRPPPGS
ncbi:hypothetical protein ACWC10_16765 [Streptomyces sp. NPDC001595]|uniref:hypothetical protein n=1 Tax=Streptomyces sp. NPDC001532 TaxID=3154520 RepID=UPI003316F273